jgi:hypothetical protein
MYELRKVAKHILTAVLYTTLGIIRLSIMPYRNRTPSMMTLVA